MKILQILPHYYPAVEYGGVVSLTHTLNKALVKKGIDVSVITTNAGVNKDLKWKNVEGVKVKYFPFIGKDNYVFSPKMFFYLLKNIKKYDIVHLHSVWSFPILAGALACRLNKKKYILSPHGMLYKEAFEINSKNRKKLYYNLFARNYIKKASLLHFTTKDEEEKVKKYLNLNNRSTVIHNCIDLDEFKDIPKKGYFKNKFNVEKYLLFLSRINKKKGLDILIRSFKEISKKHKYLNLVIAGPDDGYKREVKEMIEKKGLNEKVIFTGMLKGNDKLAAFSESEAFVLPSYSENFGIVVLEAMACKTPVIISNKVGVFNEVLENDAGLVINNDSDELVKAINKILNNKKLNKKLINNGLNFVKNNYGADKIADEMIEGYKKC